MIKLRNLRWGWIIQIDPNSITRVLTRGRQREIVHTEEENGCDHRGKGWGDADVGQGAWAATRKKKGQGTHSPLEPLERAWPY